MSSLRFALNANAVFSILTGLPLTFATSASANVLGFQPELALKLLGLGLLLHAIVLFWAQKHDAVLKWARMNVAVIAPYPFLILGLIATGQISGALGSAFAGADGLIVGLIAIWQFRAIGARAATD